LKLRITRGGMPNNLKLSIYWYIYDIYWVMGRWYEAFVIEEKEEEVQVHFR